MRHQDPHLGDPQALPPVPVLVEVGDEVVAADALPIAADALPIAVESAVIEVGIEVAAT
jgi:hypothetical protein